MFYLHVDDSGLQNILGHLDRVARPDPRMLELIGRRLTDIIIEDNRKGVLEGKDKDDVDMPELVYRDGHGQATAARGRADDVFGSTRGRFKGFQGTPHSRKGPKGERAILENNNLATWLYQTMDGARLAPRDESSRVIANFERLAPVISGNVVIAECTWRDVVDTRGRPFLQYHFNGGGRTPKYDLRGVRQWGIREARQSAQEWALALLDL